MPKGILSIFVSLLCLWTNFVMPHVNQQEAPPAILTEKQLRKQATTTLVPIYPDEAIKSRIKGTVGVEITVNENGDVINVKSINSPNAILLSAVETAVKQWKFKKFTVSGSNVKVIGKLTFYFELYGKKGVVKPTK
jgi:TonB family protein